MADYAVNDYVRYVSNGICQITDIVVRQFPKAQSMTRYYVLKPVVSPSMTLYVPMESASLTAKFSRVPGKAELNALIESTDQREIDWLEDRNARNAAFQAILDRCDQRELLALARCIYKKKESLRALGRKISSMDESILKQTVTLIESEFSFVLQIRQDEVGAYIRDLIGVNGDD